MLQAQSDRFKHGDDIIRVAEDSFETDPPGVLREPCLPNPLLGVHSRVEPRSATFNDSYSPCLAEIGEELWTGRCIR